MNQTIFLTGIGGQTGSYLAEHMLNKGCDVHGMIRRSSNFNTQRIDHLYNNPHLHLHYGDMTDPICVNKLVEQIKPDKIFNLAAQSHVQVSFDVPYYTAQVDAIGTLNILEAVKNHSPQSKILQASTSELFGLVQEIPQTEKTPFYPRSPYGIAKLYGYWITKNYREGYNLFACNSICFNHESERRGETFVTRKITKGLSKWLKTQQPILLGNLEAKRDWGYAPEYAAAMDLMLEQDKPDDYIIATSEAHSIREFVEESIKYIDVDFYWEGSGVNEIGYDRKTGKVIIEIDPKYFRPTEVDLLIGDYTKAKTILGWEPKTKFKELVKIMMEHDLKKYAW